MRSNVTGVTLGLLAGTVLLPAAPAPARDIVTSPFAGVTHIQRIVTSPRPLFINILEIDMGAAGLDFRVSPRDPNPPIVGGVPDETITQTTRQYTDEQNAQIGVNASYFRLEHSGQARWTNNLGLTASDGDVYSPFDNTAQRALNITAGNVASIVRSTTGSGTTPTPNVPIHNAVTGNVDVLRDGNVVDRSRSDDPAHNGYLHPRTAAGVNQAGNKLWLVTVDGRQDGFSEGMYHDELGSLFQSLGARNAINLDGGGSTTMAFDYYGDVDHGGNAIRSQLVNATPGNAERYNGTSLAVFAAPNPSFRAPKLLPQTLTVLDDFERNEGRFTSGWNSSGTTDGIASASAFDWSGQQSARGIGSQRLRLVHDDGADGTDRLRLRHLSNGGAVDDNVQLGKTGHVGFLLKVVTTAVDDGDFTASLLIDDEDNPDDSTPRMEQARPIPIVADGEWHLYQWDLADAADWMNFLNGNGAINRASVTLDSVFIEAPQYRGDVTFFLDAVSFNSAGDLSSLIPEPASALAAALALAPVLIGRRRRG